MGGWGDGVTGGQGEVEVGMGGWGDGVTGGFRSTKREIIPQISNALLSICTQGHLQHTRCSFQLSTINDRLSTIN